MELVAKLIVLLLTNCLINNLMQEPLLDDCKSLLKKFHRSTIQHIFKEVIQCVDALVKFGAPHLLTMLLITHHL